MKGDEGREGGTGEEGIVGGRGEELVRFVELEGREVILVAWEGGVVDHLVGAALAWEWV